MAHGTKKPGCGPEIMEYFRKHPETGVTRPDQIVIVGDRLTTDVMMANMMGSYAVWVKDGVIPLEEISVVSTYHSLYRVCLLIRYSSRDWSRNLQVYCIVEAMWLLNQQVPLKDDLKARTRQS